MEIDCVDDVCDVGGLCEADNDIHCVCPGDVSGDTCETFFLETAVRILCAKVCKSFGKRKCMYVKRNHVFFKSLKECLFNLHGIF